MKKKQKCYIYTRVSTAAQVDGYSLDAQNMKSVRLAEKLGYEFDHEYTAYEVSGEDRTH